HSRATPTAVRTSSCKRCGRTFSSASRTRRSICSSLCSRSRSICRPVGSRSIRRTIRCGKTHGSRKWWPVSDLARDLRDALADRYTIERELGRGGMATVFLARDLRHDRPVALKVLHPELAQALGPERFQREIRMAARLQHPHILTVLDSGEAGTRL